MAGQRKRVFDSVFGRPDISQPTPVATPSIGFTAPGNAFGQLPTHNNQLRTSFASSQDNVDNGDDQIRWDRSWHNVTYALNLPNIPRDSSDPVALLNQQKALEPGFRESLREVLDPQRRLPLASHTEDVITWYTHQSMLHLQLQILPILLDFDDELDPGTLLFRSVKVLEATHRLYLRGPSIIADEITSIKSPPSREIVQKFRRDLHALTSNSMTDKLAIALKTVLRHYVSVILGLHSNQPDGTFIMLPENASSDKALGDCLRLIETLKDVGLAGEKFQVTFAEVMNDAMSVYVYLGCKGIWSPDGFEDRAQGSMQADASTLPRTAHHNSPSPCVTDLCDWIQDRYAKLATQVLDMIDEVKTTPVKVTLIQVEKWKEMGIGHLASLRTNEMFDIVENWPKSSGALDDLRTAITTPQRRLLLTDIFASTLNTKLLHPGTSTLQILQTYISMIRSFHELDQSKVLLDRVAYPLQVYLCSREDTVKIIITGLLSDTEDAQGNPVQPGGDKLVELALALNSSQEQVPRKTKDEELDWHDMDWMPDPVDAGPGYKRSKSADIIGTLIGVLGSQEVFIKEFQNIIGENLLKHDGAFEKEIKVLELLKIKFGEAPLQGCEVMLKDIQDSGRVDAVIRRNEKLEPTNDEINIAHANFDIIGSGYMAPEGMLKPSLHAKILSRLFWPQLHDETYRVPDEIAKLHDHYEHGFESLKASRKLTWLNALGQATVELELKDRKISEEVHTWQATVIWAFQGDEDTVVKRSVQDLVQQLEMDEALVRSALKFWANKLVLQETEKDVFAVLETLNQEDRARSNAQAAATAAGLAALDESSDDALMAKDGFTAENKQIYWQFIQGMLKNSPGGAMPLQQIAMMLKMLVPDGFPHSNEELQELLGWKVDEGGLDSVGGKYKLKK